MLEVPLDPVPSQTVFIVLDGQSCQISLNTDYTGLFFDLSINGVTICTRVICRNLAGLVTDAQYRGVVGNFVFYDTQGGEDPSYTELGSRYQLEYIQVSDGITLQ